MVAPLAFKPDLDEAARRWDAFYVGDLIDRPVVCVTAPRQGKAPSPPTTYHERVHGDMHALVDRMLASAEATYWGGEAIPSVHLSFGPDEIGVFCGGEFGWSPDSGDTNWSIPFVESWETALPLALRHDHPLWRRMLDFYRLASARMAGKMLLHPLDLHTNMDLLAAVRGAQRLCYDLVEHPEWIDRAMQDARAVFPAMWRAIAEAGQMDRLGYCQLVYSMQGAGVLQCDFSCMISPAMFRRWVLPALEEEAAIVGRVVYHWDGPAALVHAEDLIASPRLHTLSFVPGDGHGTHLDWLDVLKRVQAGGKTVHVWGPPELMKRLHRELRPEKTLYVTWADSQPEAEALLDWFVRNT